MVARMSVGSVSSNGNGNGHIKRLLIKLECCSCYQQRALRPQLRQVAKVIWHKAASPPRTDR